MIPVFYPGDHVLTFNWVVPKENDVVVFGKETKLFIKRIKKISAIGFLCIGDNRKHSKTNYRVNLEEIVGKVIFKY